jgi:hypothetical protein
MAIGTALGMATQGLMHRGLQPRLNGRRRAPHADSGMIRGGCPRRVGRADGTEGGDARWTSRPSPAG